MIDSLRVDIHAGLQQQTLDGYNQMYDAAIADELVRLSTIKYPPEMVESEQNSVIENFKQRLVAQGSDLDLYLKTRNMDIEALKAEAKPSAEERIPALVAVYNEMLVSKPVTRADGSVAYSRRPDPQGILNVTIRTSAGGRAVMRWGLRSRGPKRNEAAPHRETASLQVR